MPYHHFGTIHRRLHVLDSQPQHLHLLRVLGDVWDGNAMALHHVHLARRARVVPAAPTQLAPGDAKDGTAILIRLVNLVILVKVAPANLLQLAPGAAKVGTVILRLLVKRALVKAVIVRQQQQQPVHGGVKAGTAILQRRAKLDLAKGDIVQQQLLVLGDVRDGIVMRLLRVKRVRVKADIVKFLALGAAKGGNVALHHLANPVFPVTVVLAALERLAAGDVTDGTVTLQIRVRPDRVEMVFAKPERLALGDVKGGPAAPRHLVSQV